MIDTTVRRGSFADWAQQFGEADLRRCELDRARYALKVIIDEREGGGVFGQIGLETYRGTLLNAVDDYLLALKALDQ